MFIVSRPIRCEMKPQKITDKPQQGSVTTWYETTSWLFPATRNLQFPLWISLKKLFLTTNQHQSLDSVCSETKLPNNLKVPLWSYYYLLVFRSESHRILWKNENAFYRLQIRALVPAIFKFEKCVKYANEMTDDVIHSTQHCINYINRAILANVQRRPLKLGRLIILQKTHLRL